MPAGKVVPLTAFPLLREDTLKSSMLHLKVDLGETAEVIKNGVQCRFQAWFIPFLAFERFDGGMDEFNRSYMKQNNANGGTGTPFFNTMTAGPVGSIPIHKYLGFHAAPTDIINTCYIEAYNLVYNFRLRNRSETLYQAKKVNTLTSTALQPAFWQHQQYKYVVPDWDDLAMEGSVDLSFTNARINVDGVGIKTNSQYSTTSGTVYTPAGNVTATSGAPWTAGASSDAIVLKKQLAAALPDISVNLANAGVKISLANIQLAKETQWWAELKAQFEGIPDTWIVDLLMQGVSVPEQIWKQPIKIADKTEVFGIEKRWATDGANLTDAVVNGSALCDLDIVLPRTPTGGIVMVTAEILPEQLFERARDPMLFITDPDKLPNAMRDSLDPQKVERMSNGEIDTSHASPNGLFGYYPLHFRWQQSNTRIGGKWFKAAPDNVFNEERMHFWVVERPNPTLGSDFMISETFNVFPFADRNSDVAEVECQGTAIIEGNTQFGERLIENDNAYSEVLAKVDQSRITKGV
ncbi:hypothetical protein [Agrobacterium larrymoorei]|uniref:Major capsid protein n=1 Tax=Agrobacterium larrymoorei TaxID=160699 RepID=A0AAF0H8Y1_9HYPH|nr:hypothetical protein [Agrobacterium larrymoorei]WHA39891.1 hypothetical protein CFBP5477_008485 [Agrobacterium larrymoorei]